MNNRRYASWGLALSLSLVLGLTAPQAEDLEFTVWQGNVEAFVEYPALTEGERARLVVHLTMLENNEPVRQGRLTVTLRAPDGWEQRVEVDAPARTGIYLPELVPTRAGRYHLVLALEHSVGTHAIEVPDIVVREPGEATLADAQDEDDSADYITFLKEQQWRMEFATQTAIREPIARRLSLPAVVEAVPGRYAEVVAPSRGTLRPVEGRPWPLPGLVVRAGQAIAELIPLAGVEDTARLDADLQAAEARLRVARAELSRVRTLVGDGVIPERRLLEAEAEEETARSAHAAAATRYRQAHGADPGRAAALGLRPPLDGVVTASHAAPGQVVEAGTPIAIVLDDRRIWIRVLVPAQDIALVDAPRDLRIRRPGSRDWLRLEHAPLAHRGHTLEQGALSLVYDIDNDSLPSRLPIGLPLIASLSTGAAAHHVTVPEQALLDDDGVAVVMVMHGGESFERRPVRTGVRAAGRVAILDGLGEHERIVTKGAYAVLLAGRDPSALDHGHAH